MKTIIRTLHPVTRILDEKEGLVEYVASDETLDSYREVIRANGWRFDHFSKNAPFLDSHQYRSISDALGAVVDFGVTKGKLVETVKWAIDVAENTMARFGFAMTQAGYLKAVSVGFQPVRVASFWDSNPITYAEELKDLGYKSDDKNAPRVVYQEQQQIELSAVVIGANPNALARAYKAGILDDAGLDKISDERARRITAISAVNAAHAEIAREQRRKAFLEKLEKAIKRS